MPTLKFKHIASVSSEDPNHPATNLLSQDTYRKWQCSSVGEKQAVVVIELEKSSQIHSIDIGNNGSAFIEVLVGKSSSSSEDYKVLIVASSFMSPADSKGWTNINRVRMFGNEKLSKSVSDQNWDLVKIVCTQPFNKNEKYGLSFITLHSPPDKTTPTDTPPAIEQPKKLGIFKLKDDVPNLPSGSLFQKRVQSPATPTTSLAAEARKASAQAFKDAELKQQTSDTSSTPTSNTAVSKQKHSSSYTPKGTPPVKKQKFDDSAIEFDELLKGVVFSLSGFKNPLRGELRSKGLDMGAKYEPDWGPTSTHLICAFAGTPKHKQVKAKKGLVVKKEWLIKCHSSKKRLPSSKFRFPSEDDSEDEIDFYDSKETEIFKKVTYSSTQRVKKSPSKPVKEKNDVDQSANTGGADNETKQCDDDPPPVTTTDDPYGGSTDDEYEQPTMEYEQEEEQGFHKDSEECDTEDEIERVKQKNSNKKNGKNDTMEVTDIQDKTEEEPESNTNKSLLDLPTFFSDCHFLLYGDFDASDTKLIKRYITAYSGHVEEYMSNKVTHVISMSSWDDNFDQALSENSSLLFIKPSWIFKCHSKQSLVPCQPFIIAPS